MGIMHDLLKLAAERIGSGLKRRSIDKPSKWAEHYRVVNPGAPENWSFDEFPWLREMHDSEARMNVGMKAAQMGFTETILNLSFYNIDILGVSVLYVLPNKIPDASDFSLGRFNPALELSPHLRKLFSKINNLGLKCAGTANLYIRGSQARPGLKSIPCGFIVIDELAECNQDNIPLALERSSGQKEEDKAAWLISTPTLPNKNIHERFVTSTQEEYMFRCPHCSRTTDLIFPDNLVITADHINDPRIHDTYLICRECKHVLDHATKRYWLKDGIWVPKYPGRDSRGFHISQLYSIRLPLVEIAQSYLLGLTNPTAETEFFNSKLGVTHMVENAQISDDDIDKCIKASPVKHRNDDPIRGTRLVTMGIDVGKWIHYEIDQWIIKPNTKIKDIHTDTICKVVRFGKVQTIEEIDALIKEHQPLSIVIDAQPERRMALDLAKRFYGKVRLCFYTNGITGKTIKIDKDTDDPFIKVDRTAWLDVSLGRFRNKTIHLPTDINQEYRDHIRALVRQYKKDKSGNPIGFYEGIRDGIADHHAHSRNYAELALPFALSLGQSQDMYL